MNLDWKCVELLLDATVAKESTRTEIKVRGNGLEKCDRGKKDLLAQG
jgi:hypothetical protein